MKKIRILIIALIAILAIGCLSFAVVYFATDTFKSNKESFNKYIAELKAFTDINDFTAYANRLSNENHTSIGKLETSSDFGEGATSGSINYSTKVDTINKKASAEITLNSDGKDLLTIGYLRNNDFYGILFKDIVNQYVVVENNNLKDLLAKLGVENVEQVPNKIEKSKVDNTINTAKLEELLNKYFKIFVDSIPEKNYSKLSKETITLDGKEIKADGYKLTLKYSDLKNILVKILETAKDDEEILNTINSIIAVQDENNKISFSDYQEAIEQVLESNNDIEIEEDNELIGIKIYKQGNNLAKINVKIAVEDEGIEFNIEKDNNIYLNFDNENVAINIILTSNEEQTSFELNAIPKELGEVQGNINVKFSTNVKSDTNNKEINATFKIDAGSEGNISYVFSNETTFDSNVEIEEFAKDNHMVINNLSEEQMKNLATNLGKLISEKVDFEKVVQIFPATNLFINTKAGLLEKARNAAQENENALIREQNLINNNETIDVDGFNQDNISNNAVEQMNNQEISLFNTKFTMYEGIVSGNQLKMLLQQIDSNNINQPQHTVTYNNVNIDTTKMYIVTFGYDSQGYVNAAIITEQ